LLENPYDLLEIQKIVPKLKDNFIIRNLWLMKNLNFGVKRDLDNKKEKNNYVLGDKILLREILDKKFYIKNFKFFKKYNLLFLNQITTLDVSQLLGEGFLFKRKYVNDSCLNSFMDFKVYQKIKEKLCVMDSFELVSEYQRSENSLELRGTLLHLVDESHIKKIGHSRLQYGFFFSIKLF
jgi:hypothetical protein